MTRFTVEQVGPSRQITTKYGQRNVYSVKFNQNENWVDVMQKPELPQPTVNQEMEGEIEKNQYGYTLKKATSQFPMRTPGYSNRQVALQCAARIATSATEALTTAEKFLQWLDTTPTVTTPQSATVPTDFGAQQPPAENYQELGL